VISVVAYWLLIHGTADSVNDDRPGFVPDDYLDSRGPGAAVAVLELVTSGYWERVDGGYRIRDLDLLRMTTEHVQVLKEQAARRDWLRIRAEQEEVLRRAREERSG
jgi:hypothetical protein